MMSKPSNSENIKRQRVSCNKIEAVLQEKDVNKSKLYAQASAETEYGLDMICM